MLVCGVEENKDGKEESYRTVRNVFGHTESLAGQGYKHLELPF